MVELIDAHKTDPIQRAIKSIDELNAGLLKNWRKCTKIMNASNIKHSFEQLNFRERQKVISLVIW